MLTWYYANALTRQSRARQSAQASSLNRAQGDMPLPSLGRIDPPSQSADSVSSPSVPNAATLREIPLEVSPITPKGGAQPKTAEQVTLERQLSGVVYSAQSTLPNVGAGVTAIAPTATPAEPGDWPPCCGRVSASAVRAQIVAYATAVAAEGSVHRLHAGNRHRFDAARHDHLRNGNGYVRRRWQSGVAGARYQADRRDPRAGAAGHRREYSSYGPRRERRPASSCLWPRRVPMNWAAQGSRARSIATFGSGLARRYWSP